MCVFQRNKKPKQQNLTMIGPLTLTASPRPDAFHGVEQFRAIKSRSEKSSSENILHGYLGEMGGIATKT